MTDQFEFPKPFATWKEDDDDCGAWGQADRPVFTAEQMRWAYQQGQLSRAIPEGHVVVPGWQPISTAPQNRACLIHYRNICNRDRVIKAKYVSARTIEANEDWPDEACDMDDETETAYIPAGWYEMIDNHDDCSLIGISSNLKITGWMPLPAAPAPEGEA